MEDFCPDKMGTGPSKTQLKSDVTNARGPHGIDRKAPTARETLSRIS
jgi:hypothetical protein